MYLWLVGCIIVNRYRIDMLKMTIFVLFELIYLEFEWYIYNELNNIIYSFICYSCIYLFYVDIINKEMLVRIMI